MRKSIPLTPAQRVYLDFLRAAAAMMVLFGHTAHYFLSDSFLARGSPQSIGVYLFFLISGFLISLSVFEKYDDPRYGFRAYFIDRFCRIYSAYLPALVFVVLLDFLVLDAPSYEWQRDYNLQTWLGNLVMLQDFPVFQVLRRLGAPESSWFVGPFGTARPFWTISIEWWIYMLFGGIVLVWLRQGRPLGWAGALVLGVVAVEPVYHFVGGYDHCLTMLWVIGMGASLLLIHLRATIAARPNLAPPHLLRIALAVAGAALLAIAGRLFANKFVVVEFQFGLFLAALVFALFFALGFAHLRVAPALERLVGFVAGYSYSLYLVHHTLVEFLSIHYPGRQNSPAMFWAAIAAANLLAVVFWYLFERHHRQLARWAKQRFASGRPSLGTVPVTEGFRR